MAFGFDVCNLESNAGEDAACEPTGFGVRNRCFSVTFPCQRERGAEVNRFCFGLVMEKKKFVDKRHS